MLFIDASKYIVFMARVCVLLLSNYQLPEAVPFPTILLQRPSRVVFLFSCSLSNSITHLEQKQLTVLHESRRVWPLDSNSNHSSLDPWQPQSVNSDRCRNKLTRATVGAKSEGHGDWWNGFVRSDRSLAMPGWWRCSGRLRNGLPVLR